MNIKSTLPLLTLPLGILSLQAQPQQPIKSAPTEHPDLKHSEKPPALLVKREQGQASAPLRVENLDIQVTVTGNTAETTMTMVFRNDTDRVLEGELVFPLGQGMTVSGYALEVNGKLRQGVIVPKDLARKAYENTIRQQIDPGLVEWTKGNNFRTRIYPIPAKGTKKVSVSYVETLTPNRNHLHYQLPLAFPNRIDHFKLAIDVLRPSGSKRVIVDQSAGLKLSREEKKQWQLRAEQKNFSASETLKFSIPDEDIAKQLIHRADNEDLFFYLVDSVNQPEKPLPRPTPKSLQLIWDASHSGANRDHAKELRLLKAYLKQTAASKVSLRILRNTLEEPIDFDTGQNAANLIQHLRQLRYDGATRLGLLDFSNISTDTILVVSDGISTLGSKRPTTGDKPIFLFHASQSAEHGLLESIAAQSGGAYINLHKKDTAAGLAAMLTQPYSLLAVEGEGIEQVYPSVATPAGQQLSIAGKITSNKPVQLTLKYGIGGKVMQHKSITLNPQKASTKATRVPRLWAQKKLMELDAEADKNRHEIIDLAQRHSIVTRFTSLLVLDRLEDYVRYRINPPEPELQQQYDTLLREQMKLEEKRKAEGQHFANIRKQWQEMVKWHQTNFPELGDLLIQQVALPEKQLKEREQELKQKLQQAKEKKQKETLSKQLTALKKVRAIKQQALLWKTKQGRSASPDATYKKMIQDFQSAMATLSQYNGPEGVKRLLYRAESFYNLGDYDNALKETDKVLRLDRFNQAARRLQARINAERRDYHRSAYDETRARLLSEVDKAWQIIPVTPATPAKPTTQQKPNASATKGKTTLSQWNPNTPYLKALKNAAKENTPLEPLYFEWKAKNSNSSAFFLDVADFFIQQKRPKIASRVLSNVAELDIESPALLRILAHRYDQLGSHEIAEVIFREVLRLRPEEPQSHRDLALILEKQGKLQEAADLLWHVASSQWDSRLEGIQLTALTELNSLMAKNPDQINTTAYDKNTRHNLDSDIRIVLSWDADNTDIDLWVVDPMDETCNYSKNRTKSGGRMSRDFTQGYGPEVFMIKDAIPGTYQVKAKYYGNTQQLLAGDVTIQATLITHWGRENQQSKAITLRLKDQKDVVDIGTFEFSRQ